MCTHVRTWHNQLVTKSTRLARARKIIFTSWIGKSTKVIDENDVKWAKKNCVNQIVRAFAEKQWNLFSTIPGTAVQLWHSFSLPQKAWNDNLIISLFFHRHHHTAFLSSFNINFRAIIQLFPHWYCRQISTCFHICVTSMFEHSRLCVAQMLSYSHFHVVENSSWLSEIFPYIHIKTWLMTTISVIFSCLPHTPPACHVLIFSECELLRVV